MTESQDAPVPPPPARRLRGPWWAWLCLGLGALLVVSSTLVLAGGQFFLNRYTANVRQGDLIGDDAQADQPGGRVPDRALNFLLIGSDYRAGAPDEGARSDTTMLLHIPKEHDRAFLVSFPRDLLLELPELPEKDFDGGEDKLNAAYHIGGQGDAGLKFVASTLNKFMGEGFEGFDGLMLVEFDGFTGIVNELGGVDMCVEREVRSIHTDQVFPAGCYLMDGHSALDYVRQRYEGAGVPDGDYGRMRHQQQFLKAMFKRAKATGGLSNPRKLDGLIRAAGRAVRVDPGKVSLADWLVGLRNINGDAISGIRLPTVSSTIGGTAYEELLPVGEELRQAIRQSTLDEWVIRHPEFANPL